MDNNKHSIEEMMALKYDHIFFTGSGNVAKKVMEKLQPILHQQL
ncbi:aldehyde dehydrogenase [Mycoplasmoides gallisepticum]